MLTHEFSPKFEKNVALFNEKIQSPLIKVSCSPQVGDIFTHDLISTTPGQVLMIDFLFLNESINGNW